MSKKIVWALLIALMPALGGAESLVEAARRERERREKNKQDGVKPVRVITQDDIETAKESRPAGQKRPDVAPAPATESSVESEREARQARKEEWQARAQAVRARIEEARARLAETPPYFAQGYYMAGGTIMENLVSNPAYELAAAELKTAERGMTELEDEARRAGALPGWLR